MLGYLGKQNAIYYFLCKNVLCSFFLWNMSWVSSGTLQRLYLYQKKEIAIL